MNTSLKSSHRSQVVTELLERRTLMSTWTTVDADPNGLSINSMAADRTGNVYAAGDLTDAAANVFPVLKQKTAGGATWSTIFTKPGTDYGDFTAVAVDPAGDVFVGGYGRGADRKIKHWLIYEHPARPSALAVMDA